MPKIEFLPEINQIARNTLVQIGGKIITVFATLISTVLITRALGVSGYGEYIKALSIITVVFPIVDFGFNAIIVQKLTHDNKNTKEIIQNLFGARLLIGLAIVFFLILIIPFLPYDDLANQGFSQDVKIAIIFGTILIFSQSVFTTFNAYFQYKLSYQKSVIASVCGSFATIAVTAIALVTLPSILTMIAAQIVGGLIMAATSYFLAFRMLKFIKPNFNLNFLKTILPKVLPLGLTLIFNLVYFRADMLILAWTRPTSEVAYYGIAYKIFENTLILPIFLINSIYPIFIKHLSFNFGKFKKLLKSTLIFLILSSVLIGGFLLLFSNLILKIIAGAEFIKASYALKILAVSIPFFYLSALSMWLLVSFKLQKILVYIYGFGAIVNIIANFILIPQYGHLAAALTTAASEFLILILSAVALFVFVRNTNLAKFDFDAD